MEKERERESQEREMLAVGYKERKEKMKRERERERPSEEGAQEREKRESLSGTVQGHCILIGHQPKVPRVTQPVRSTGMDPFGLPGTTQKRRPGCRSSRPNLLLARRLTPHGSRPVISAAGITRNPDPLLKQETDLCLFGTSAMCPLSLHVFAVIKLYLDAI